MTLFMLHCPQWSRADIMASISDEQIDTSETIELTVRIDGQVDTDAPDFTGLERNWTIESQQQRSKSTFNLGVTGATQRNFTEWILILAPKRDGELQIPSLSWQGMRSRSFTIKVDPISTQLQSLIDQQAFFRTSVSGDTVWIQEQIIYQVELFYAGRVQLISGMPPPPDLPNAIVQPLDNARSATRMINDRTYGVTTILYAIFPQSAGTLTLPPEQLSAYINAPGVIRGRKRINIHSSGHSIEVRSPPDSYPANQTWLPARRLDITETWKTPAEDMQVGLPATRVLTLTAAGLPASLLPNIVPDDLPDARIYEDPPIAQERLGQRGITGIRSYTHSLIPTIPGSLTIPEARIGWWDVQENRFREAVIPARTYQVRLASPSSSTTAASASSQPATAPATPVTDAAQASREDILSSGTQSGYRLAIWILSILASGGWLLAAVMLYKRRRHPSGIRSRPPTDLEIFRKFTHACRNNDAPGARTALVAWYRTAYPKARRGSSLESLIEPGDENGRQALELLNVKLYQDTDAAWDGKRLLHWVTAMRDKHRQQETGKDDRKVLPPLYPHPQDC